MIKRVGLLGAWLVATLALGFVGYGAVALVGNQVTDQPTGRVVNLSVTTTLADLVTVPDPTEPEPSIPLDEDPLTSPNRRFGGFTSPFSTDSGPDSTEDSSTTVAPATSPPTTSAPTTETQPAPPPPTTTTPTTQPSPTTSQPGEGEIVETGPFSFTSSGGIVTVTCVVDKVRFGGASPSGGATVTVIDRGPQEVEVLFATSGSQWITTVVCEDGVAAADFG
jgi:hypothetical protein